MYSLDDITAVKEQCDALSSTNLKCVLAVATALKFTEKYHSLPEQKYPD